jgi:hypothetical protein
LNKCAALKQIGIAGEFGVGKELYPSVDLGGVVEFYLSRRWLAV